MEVIDKKVTIRGCPNGCGNLIGHTFENGFLRCVYSDMMWSVHLPETTVWFRNDYIDIQCEYSSKVESEWSLNWRRVDHAVIRVFCRLDYYISVIYYYWIKALDRIRDVCGLVPLQRHNPYPELIVEPGPTLGYLESVHVESLSQPQVRGNEDYQADAYHPLLQLQRFCSLIDDTP